MKTKEWGAPTLGIDHFEITYQFLSSANQYSTLMMVNQVERERVDLFLASHCMHRDLLAFL